MKQLREIIKLSLAHLVNDIYAPILMALQPVLITMYGYSYFEAALLPVTHSLVSSLLQPVFGHLVDRYGINLSVGVSILLSGIGVSLLGLIPGQYFMMLTCVVISGIGHSSFHPGALCKVSALASRDTRGKLTSFFVVGGNMGIALGPLIAGIIFTSGGIQMVSVLFIPAVIAACLLFFWPIPDSCMAEKKEKPAGGKNWNPVILLFAGSTLRSWVTFGAMTFFPTLLVLQGYPLLEATSLVSFMLVAGVAGQISGGIISDRIGRKKVVIISTLTSVPAMIGVFSTHGILLIVSMMIFGFLLWSSFAVIIAMAHELIPSQIGLISGLFLGIAMGAGGIGVSVSGALADRIGLMQTLETFPIIILVSSILFIMVRSRSPVVMKK
jgi:FSR family fosmidomycin resistance protein-like MFS transporter